MSEANFSDSILSIATSRSSESTEATAAGTACSASHCNRSAGLVALACLKKGKRERDCISPVCVCVSGPLKAVQRVLVFHARWRAPLVPDTLASPVFHQVALTISSPLGSVPWLQTHFDSELPCPAYWLKLPLESYPTYLNNIYLPLQPFLTFISTRFSSVASNSAVTHACATQFRSVGIPLHWLQYRNLWHIPPIYFRVEFR